MINPEMLGFMDVNFSNWVAGILCLFILSLLYKENPLYRIAEHLYVGTSAAHTFINSWHNTLLPSFQTRMVQNGQWWELVPIIVGMLIYFNVYRPLSWLARIPMSFWIGYNAAIVLSVRTVVPWLNEIIASMKPLVVMKNGAFMLGTSISNIIFVVSILCTVIYFFFTIEHTGIFGYAAKWGRYAIMIGFGASFGNTVAARISLLIGRINFIMGDWMGLLP